MLRMSWDSKDRTTLSLNMGNVAADVVELRGKERRKKKATRCTWYGCKLGKQKIVRSKLSQAPCTCVSIQRDSKAHYSLELY
ncbi:hypothetical protein RJT34_16247 [Clitoria ternatea]|uniref:Uncharacterized protein n=1 Tax=Clitoria ternatea TaxID=43366 RepID=A0AAN9J6U6_CLITE